MKMMMQCNEDEGEVIEGELDTDTSEEIEEVKE